MSDLSTLRAQAAAALADFNRTADEFIASPKTVKRPDYSIWAFRLGSELGALLRQLDAEQPDAPPAECAECFGPIESYTDPDDGQTTRWRHHHAPDNVAVFLDGDHQAEPRQGR